MGTKKRGNGQGSVYKMKMGNGEQSGPLDTKWMVLVSAKERVDSQQKKMP